MSFRTILNIGFAVVTALLVACTAGDEEASISPSISIDEPIFTADGMLQIDAQLSGYRENNIAMPSELTLRIFITENPRWNSPDSPWIAYHDEDVMRTPGAEPKALMRDLVLVSTQGEYQAVFTNAFHSVEVWTAEGECPFESFIIKVNDRGIAEAEREFPCEPLPESAFQGSMAGGDGDTNQGSEDSGNEGRPDNEDHFPFTGHWILEGIEANESGNDSYVFSYIVFQEDGKGEFHAGGPDNNPYRITSYEFDGVDEVTLTYGHSGNQVANLTVKDIGGGRISIERPSVSWRAVYRISDQ